MDALSYTREDMTGKTKRLPLAKLFTESASAQRVESLDWFNKLDRDRWYICPSATPLYYTAIYGDLGYSHQLRYNQLTAVLYNELIAFFESEFASSVCVALSTALKHGSDDELAKCLHGFVAEEQEHIRLWRQLSRLSEPESYSDSRDIILRIPNAAKSLLGQLTRNPKRFPIVFWIMLALEERSLDISRRCLRMNRDDIEPHYLAVYRDHLKDETRHVHIDWHLIDRYYANSSLPTRKLNAWLLRMLISKFFLPPNQSAIRVVQRLAQERPELAPMLPTLEKQLRALGSDHSYQAMMYSRETTPITFKLFDRFPEMHRMQRVLHTYSPPVVQSS